MGNSKIMSWEDSEKELSSGVFLKLEDGSTKMRVVSEPIVRKNHWKDNKPYSCSGEECVLCEDSDEKVRRIAKKFVFHVIDRKGKAFAIVELPPSVAKKIRDFQTEDDGDYSFNEKQAIAPYDITVKKSGQGLKTEYDVMPARKNTELTAEELDGVEKLKPLSEILTPSPTWDKPAEPGESEPF